MTDLDYILKILLTEENNSIPVPSDVDGKRRLMRSLLNIRPPLPVNDEFINAQNSELQNQLNEKGIIEINEIPICTIDNRIRLWQGDITRLKVDAIVNAANNQLLGCFIPMHGCIDNAIHSAAGIQLRLRCHEIMQQQDHTEQTGTAKITLAYNLPSKYVIHTVGPIIGDRKLSTKDKEELADCYRSCLELADRTKLESIAFCCISTGEFKFPNRQAGEIAVDIVISYFQKQPDTVIKTVIFNVFKDVDFNIYNRVYL